MLTTHQATRYVTPLKEGGSLPAVLDTEDAGLFVTKFRGAGQGAKALIAEIVVGLLAERLGLPMPEMVLIELDDSFGRSERDPEIQDILQGSRGLNVGHRYLEGAFNFDPLADAIEPELAARIVWLDAFTSNLDRTARNPNLLWWRGRPWLIDHGAALYFHHDWASVDDERARQPFAQIEDHVLLATAAELGEADAHAASILDDETIRDVVGAVPDQLLMDAPAGIAPAFASATENRAAYVRYLTRRLAAPRPFVAAAAEARERVRAAPRRPSPYRR